MTASSKVRRSYFLPPTLHSFAANQKPSNSYDDEIDSATLTFDKKRYFIDVVENWRGRFIKLTESIGGGGGGGGQLGPARKARIHLTMASVRPFRKALDEMINCNVVEGDQPHNSLPTKASRGGGELLEGSVTRLQTTRSSCTRRRSRSPTTCTS